MTLDELRGSYLTAHLAARGGRGSTAVVRADLRPLPTTVIRGGLFSSLFTTVTLYAAEEKFGSLAPPASAPALLLVAASLFSLFVSGQGETATTTRLVTRLRMLAVIPALCSFFAAGLIVAAYKAQHARDIISGLAIASGVVTATFAVTAFQNRRRRRRLPKRRRSEGQSAGTVAITANGNGSVESESAEES